MAMQNNDIDERGKHEEELDIHEILGGRLNDETGEKSDDVPIYTNETLLPVLFFTSSFSPQTAATFPPRQG